MATPNEIYGRSSTWLDIALFMATIAFCVYSAHSLGQSPFRGKAAPVSATAPENASRAPAQVKMQTVPEKTTQVLSLGCFSDAASHSQTTATILQISAAPCGSKSFRARNETTGEELLIFESKTKVATHFFPLREGKNRIVIAWRGDKKNEKVIEVERR